MQLFAIGDSVRLKVPTFVDDALGQRVDLAAGTIGRVIAVEPTSNPGQAPFLYYIEAAASHGAQFIIDSSDADHIEKVPPS